MDETRGDSTQLSLAVTCHDVSRGTTLKQSAKWTRHTSRDSCELSATIGHHPNKWLIERRSKIRVCTGLKPRSVAESRLGSPHLHLPRNPSGGRYQVHIR